MKKEDEPSGGAGTRGEAEDPRPVNAQREPFGQRAIRLGFLSSEDLDQALASQRRRDAAGEAHQLIGMILVEMGCLTTTQLLSVLKTYEGERPT